jgi:hypothetical protein
LEFISQVGTSTSTSTTAPIASNGTSSSGTKKTKKVLFPPQLVSLDDGKQSKYGMEEDKEGDGGNWTALQMERKESMNEIQDSLHMVTLSSDQPQSPVSQNEQQVGIESEGGQDQQQEIPDDEADNFF